VDSRVTAAGPDVAFEGTLLRLVQHVTGGAQPHHDVISGEVAVGERGGVLGRVDPEVVTGAELLDRGHPGRDRVVPERRGLREDQRAEPGMPGGGRGRAGRSDDQNRGDQQPDHESHDPSSAFAHRPSIEDYDSGPVGGRRSAVARARAWVLVSS
jgi:hypothetical protein